MKFIYFMIICFVINFQSAAQFSLDGEIRPRTEFRNGYHNLITKEQNSGFGISTRARLNFGYDQDSYSFFVAIQDVLVWGENKQTIAKDLNNSLALFQVWASIKLGEYFKAKLGRQIISYDDQRIFGGLDWAQQGRNHDALLFQYQKDKFILDIGLAYNQDYDNISGFQSVGNTYNSRGLFSYKTMVYGYLNKNWKSIYGSFLLMNNGFQNFETDGETADGISNLQTFGTHLKYNKEKLKAAVNIYLQMGERQDEIKVKSAYLTSLELTYQLNKKTLGLGMELISGNDQKSGSTSAFFPLYGTNHKFNGFMDYFYVGNHANSIGLLDIHGSANFNFGNKSSIMVKLLGFWGEQRLSSGEKYLGTEVDLVYTVQLKGYSFKAGYSQMFAGDGMYELKDVPKELAATTQNWAWAMLVFQPKFLNHNK